MTRKQIQSTPTETLEQIARWPQDYKDLTWEEIRLVVAELSRRLCIKSVTNPSKETDMKIKTTEHMSRGNSKSSDRSYKK